MFRQQISVSLACLGLLALGAVGCEDADRNAPNATPGVEVRGTPDLDPNTDDDVEVTMPDVDVDVDTVPGSNVPDVDVDVTEAPDADTDANEDEAPGTDN